MNGTDNQSLLSNLHNMSHLAIPRDRRPDNPSRAARITSYAIGAAMICLVLLAAGWRKPQPPAAVALSVATLAVPMVLLSPVCHSHYFTIAVLLVLAILVA